jgi:hypothetical protein
MFNSKIAGVHVVVRTVKRDQSAKLGERFRMIIHPNVEYSILPWLACSRPPDNHECGRLLAANITACFLCTVERCEHSVCEVAFALSECLGHSRPDCVARHQVRLHREVASDMNRSTRRSALNLRCRCLLSCNSACGNDVATAGERRNVSLCVDYTNLTDLTCSIRMEKRLQCLRRAFSCAKKIESELSV